MASSALSPRSRSSVRCAGLSLWALLLAVHVHAQPVVECSPLLGGAPVPKELVAELRAQYKAHNEGLAFPDARLRKAVVADWSELQNDLVESIEEEHFIFGTPLNALLDSTMRSLVAQLPGLRQPPRVLLSWYPWPNATCRGEGTIVVNLGLLERLNSRSELAFILGHELAHHHLDHVRRTIEEVNTKLLSDEFRSDVRTVLRQEFDRVAQLESLFISFSVSERRHGRNHETVSDSLALRLVQAAGYDPLAGPAVMDVLEACDKEPYAHEADLHAALLAGGAEENGDWRLQEEVSSLGGVDLKDRTLEEELKTHPDCDVRKGALLTLLGLPSSTAVKQHDSTFVDLRRAAALAMLESALVQADYGRAVFVGLHLVDREDHPADVHAGLALAFDGLLNYQRLHRLGQVLQQPTKEDSPAYQRTLQALNRLRGRDLAALAAYHLARAHERTPTCEQVLYATVRHAANGTSMVDLEAAKQTYRVSYPQGRYVAGLEKITLAGANVR
ncbi:MAG: M48 family metalloprotease [Flavobacteriales bacterium]|nr:M48 family metalloprotease [Flavobacteriales bacterium]